MEIKKLIIIIISTLIFNACSFNDSAIFVSPTGDDKNPGTKNKPFLSINRAKEAVIEAISEGAENEEIKVYIRGGTYYFDQTAIFNEEEFSKGTNRIIFSAFGDEIPVFNAGTKISGWSKVESRLPNLPEKAKGNVWVADIPAEGKNNPARFLFTDSSRLINAVSSGLHTTENEKTFENIKPVPTTEQLSFFNFPKKSFREWENLQDIEAVIRTYEGWIMNVLPIKSLDFKDSTAYTSIPGTYILSRLKGFWYEKQYNLWVQNAIDFLDEPGEWVINTLEGKIYYWPKENEPGDVYYPLLKEIIRIEGDQKKNKIIRNIEFRGITFVGGNRDTY